jgi:uncharacterized membrane protein
MDAATDPSLAGLRQSVLGRAKWTALVGPVRVKLGAGRLAKALYVLCGAHCHQFADRFFFLFGTKWMYSYTDLLSAGIDASTPLGLRAVFGNPELGYKVAWSEPMVALYGGILLGGVIVALLRRRFRSSTWVPLLMVPVFLDGTTHKVSDCSGLGQGFRHGNAWLAVLTQGILPESFYVGNGTGSFNSWMRLVSGLLAGLAAAFASYPLLEDAFGGARRAAENRFESPG